MPEISRFYGIVVRMFFEEHLPPHFHVEYGGHQALKGIETLAVIEGDLPPRALGLVTEWASIHQDELVDRWERARRFEASRALNRSPESAVVKNITLRFTRRACIE